jgi:hypothetical protein
MLDSGTAPLLWMFFWNFALFRSAKRFDVVCFVSLNQNRKEGRQRKRKLFKSIIQQDIKSNKSRFPEQKFPVEVTN